VLRLQVAKLEEKKKWTSEVQTSVNHTRFRLRAMATQISQHPTGPNVDEKKKETLLEQVTDLLDRLTAIESRHHMEPFSSSAKTETAINTNHPLPETPFAS
jgi:hypothetical protein